MVIFDVSVIIPVYNVEKYLEECLDSVLQQNFFSYEIICINDASTDNSGKILSSYSKRYDQIKIVTNSKNQGLSVARNLGMKMAKGKYIWFVDSDDIIIPNSLLELYSIAEENKTDIVCFDMLQVDEKQNYKELIEEDEKKIENEEICTGKEFFCRAINKRITKSEACRKFIRREFLEKNGIDFYKEILHEDELFYFLCAMNANRVLYVNKKYYIYRQRKGSIMRTKNYKRSESLFVILIQLLLYWGSHSFTERENKSIEVYFSELFLTYQRYSYFGERKEELEVGGYVEKTLYKILQKKYQCGSLTLNKMQLSQIEKAEKVIVFGSGAAAIDIINILKERKIKIDIIAVSDMEDNPEIFCGIKVDSIDRISEYIKDALVIIAVSHKHNHGIYEKLLEFGYRNILVADSVKGQEVLK